MKLYIQAMAAEVTQEELKKNLPPEVMAKIQGKTVTPYVIGEEGESNPRVIGEGQKKLTWPRAVIRRIAQVVKTGTKLFIGHNSDSSTENRKSVGEVVGSFSRIINGKLQALAVTVLTPGTEDFDICSIEADAEFGQDGFVRDIGKISGVALGSSKTQSPAFPGAQRVASLQCFGDTIVKEEIKPNTLEKGEKKPVTFTELKEAIKELNVFPHQIFSEDEMKADNTFGKIYQENERLTNESKELNTKLEDMDKSGKDAIRKGELSSAKGRLEKLLPEGTTEKSKSYILRKFNAEGLEDLSDEGLKKAMDSLQTQYSEDAKAFGIETTTDGPSGGKDDGESDKGDQDPIDAAVAATMEG